MLCQVEDVLRDLYCSAHTPEQTEKLLLALHAALTRQMRVPRCWLSQDPTAWSPALARLFSPASDRTEAETCKVLAEANLCPRKIMQIQGQDYETALHLTEDALQELLEQGSIYYDGRRLSPFSEREDLLDRAQQRGTVLPSSLEQNLRKRSQHASGMCRQFAHSQRRPADVLWPSAWLESLRGKICRTWVLHWGVGENYWIKDAADPISSLLLADDL